MGQWSQDVAGAPAGPVDPGNCSPGPAAPSRGDALGSGLAFPEFSGAAVREGGRERALPGKRRGRRSAARGSWGGGGNARGVGTGRCGACGPGGWRSCGFLRAGEGGSSGRLWRRTRSEGLERMEEEEERSCKCRGFGRRLSPGGCVRSNGHRGWLCNGDLLAGPGWAGLGLEALSALAPRGSSSFLFVSRASRAAPTFQSPRAFSLPLRRGFELEKRFLWIDFEQQPWLLTREVCISWATTRFRSPLP